MRLRTLSQAVAAGDLEQKTELDRPDGRIDVDSSVRQGTTSTILLPKYQPDAAA